MLIQYHTEALPALAEIHRLFAQSGSGIPPLSQNHWESLFTRPDVDPEKDIFILSNADQAEITGFSWLYTQPAPSYAYIRGPYAQPGKSGTLEIVKTLINHNVNRGRELGIGFVEGRSMYGEWVVAFTELGFKRMGAYERYRLFPLKGTVQIYPPPPDGGLVRTWRGLTDLPSLMDIFRAAFESHWDYRAPVRSDWIEILNSGGQSKNIISVAEMNGRIIGYSFGQRLQELSEGPYDSSYLASIGVYPEFRRMGWGKVLLGHWLRLCYGTGIRSVELDVDENNEAAIGLYKDFEFKFVRSDEVWRKYL